MGRKTIVMLCDAFTASLYLHFQDRGGLQQATSLFIFCKILPAKLIRWPSKQNIIAQITKKYKYTVLRMSLAHQLF